MGKIIVCTGLEDNIGTTSSSLFLAETFSHSINDKVLLCDMYKKSPKAFRYFSDEDSSMQNVNIVMNYAISNEDLSVVINGSTTKLTNSMLEILPGNLEEDFNDTQYMNFINCMKNNYEIAILLYNIGNIPKIVLDYADNIIILGVQNTLSLKTAHDKYNKLIESDKSMIVINKYEDGILSLNKISELLNKKVAFKIRYSKDLIKKLNESNLNIQETKYEEDFINISDYYLNLYGLKKPKKTLLSFLKK